MSVVRWQLLNYLSNDKKSVGDKMETTENEILSVTENLICFLFAQIERKLHSEMFITSHFCSAVSSSVQALKFRSIWYWDLI